MRLVVIAPKNLGEMLLHTSCEVETSQRVIAYAATPKVEQSTELIELIELLTLAKFVV